MGLLKVFKAQLDRSRSTSDSTLPSRSPSPKRNDSRVDSHDDVPRLLPQTRKDFLSVQSGHSLNSGRYQIESRLGVGNYSEVWQALDVRSGTHVALKILSTDFYNGGTRLWELEILSRIRNVSATSSHPGRHRVATMIDHFEHPASPRPHVCIVLQMLGPSIESQMLECERTRLPYRTCKHISRQLLEALDFIHSECGVLHTDISLDNVLVDRHMSTDSFPSIYRDSDVKVRLGDFGLACWSNEHLDDRVQRPLHRAPEITLEALWDKSADIFDLGCFIYQIVTGTTPFPGSHAHEVTSISGEQDRLSQLTQLFGPVPDVVLDEALRKADFYDDTGLLRQFSTADSDTPLQLDEVIRGRCRASLVGGEMSPHEVPVFCAFLEDALATDPRQRKTAQSLLSHPWLALESDMAEPASHI